MLGVGETLGRGFCYPRVGKLDAQTVHALLCQGDSPVAALPEERNQLTGADLWLGKDHVLVQSIDHRPK